MIKDTSTLAKLRDELPKNLFCFDTMFKIRERHTKSTLFYFFTYSLWNEAIFNEKISPKTRLYFLFITLCIFSRLESFYNSKEFDQKVFEKKGIDHQFISFITKDKIIRIINTLIVIIKEIISSSDGKLGLNRLGSHTIENFIGRIRSLCHQDNRFETVLHNLSRYELIVRDFDQCFLVFKPRHTNPGGSVLSQEGADFDSEFEPDTIVEWLFQSVGMSDETEDNQLNAFFEKLKEFSDKYPYPKVNLPNTLNNLPILSRLYISNVISQEKEWEQKEIDLIDELLLSNNEKKIYLKKTFNHSKISCKMMVQQRKDILRNREWSQKEDDFITQYITRKITLKQLRSIIYLRDKKQITQRKNELIEKKNISSK